MEKLGSQRPQNLARVCLSFFLVTAVVISGCGSKASPTPKPATASAVVPTPTAPTAPPAASEGTIPIPSGGSILVPEGALPKDAKVSVTTTDMPLLPGDVEPVGEAIAISATAQPAEPVTLRLPVPAGVADPSSLVIIRVESDGTTTFLMTEVEGNELVAATPGFTTFAAAKLLPGTKLRLIGKSVLPVGDQETYYVTADFGDRIFDGEWTAGKGLALVGESPNAAIVEGISKTSVTALTYECIDLAQGRRWFGAASLAVIDNLSTVSNDPFSVSIVTLTPIAYAGKDVQLRAGVYGEFKTPITWTWDFGDGESGGPVKTDAGTTTYNLPVKQYSPSELPKTFLIEITAKDDDGRQVTRFGDIRVVAEPFRVALEGPQILSWNDPGASSAYTASVTGGKAPYRYSWLLSPGGERRDVSDFATEAQSATSTELFIFNEPGVYRLEVTVTDAQKTTATAILPIRIEGGEALSTHILNLPATAKPKENITINIQVRGGVLALSGQKAGYTLRIDWGDRSEPVGEENVGATRTSYEGTVVPASHSYAESDTYTVKVEAFDPTRSSASDSREITITDAAPAASPTAPKTNAPPVAEDISTSTKSGTAVQITLKGTDADGDKLTYTFARPSNGTLTGTAPFMTYTPKMGFAGTDTFTYTVRDGKADSPAATVSILVEELKWVLDGAPLVNATDPKQPLEYYGGGQTPGYFTEPRFEGKFTIYRLSETSIAVDDRDVDHGFENYNVTIESRFDAPPPILMPGRVITLTVQFSSSGDVTAGNPGAIFQYGADKSHRSIVQPADALGYSPWNPAFSGQDSKSWTLTVPQGRLGDTFQVWAGWWNCPVCNVTWTYKAE